MNSETWAIVGATFFGPVFAVLITFWRDARNSLSTRRLFVFRTLMATRSIGISREHVNSLNLVEVDFYGCPNVQETWKSYKTHLFKSGPTDEVWHEEKEKLLAQLLFEMSKTLHLNISAMEIFKGGYSPTGWAHRENRQNEAMEFIYDLSTGAKTLPIEIKNNTRLATGKAKEP